MTLHIIGLSGKKGSGKNAFATLASALLSLHGFKCHQMALADPLKAEVAAALAPSSGRTEKDLIAAFNDPKQKGDFRLILQWWGTEYRRHFFGEDYWRKQAMETALDFLPVFNGKTLYPDEKIIVFVTDVRFPDEAAWVQGDTWPCGINTHLVRVMSDCVIRDAHPSETALDDFIGFDAVVANNRSEIDFFKQVDGCLRHLHILPSLKG